MPSGYQLQRQTHLTFSQGFVVCHGCCGWFGGTGVRRVFSGSVSPPPPRSVRQSWQTALRAANAGSRYRIDRPARPLAHTPSAIAASVLSLLVGSRITAVDYLWPRHRLWAKWCATGGFRLLGSIRSWASI